MGGKVMGWRSIYPTPRSPSTGMPDAASIAISRQIERTETPKSSARSAARCKRPSRRIWIRSNNRFERDILAGLPHARVLLT